MRTPRKHVSSKPSGRDATSWFKAPPGTGKSQTITNIIAAAVHDGQSVLAALTVVHERVRAAGLGRTSASNSVARRQASASLPKTGSHLASGRLLRRDGRDGHATDSGRADHLNHFAKRLHAQIGDTAMTPYQAAFDPNRGRPARLYAGCAADRGSGAVDRQGNSPRKRGWSSGSPASPKALDRSTAICISGCGGSPFRQY